LSRSGGSDFKERLGGLQNGQFQSGSSSLALEAGSENLVEMFRGYGLTQEISSPVSKRSFIFGYVRVKCGISKKSLFFQ